MSIFTFRDFLFLWFVTICFSLLYPNYSDALLPHSRDGKYDNIYHYHDNLCHSAIQYAFLKILCILSVLVEH